jgi:hypothetical protein
MTTADTLHWHQQSGVAGTAWIVVRHVVWRQAILMKTFDALIHQHTASSHSA